MVVSQETIGLNGNPPGTKYVYEKKEVNVIKQANGVVALAVSESGGIRPADPNHQNYRRLSINLNVTSGTPIQISNVTGRNGVNSINSIAPNGYIIAEIFVNTQNVPSYDATLLLLRGGTGNANIITEMNINEGGIELKGGEKNNTFSTAATYIQTIGYTGNLNIVVGFWY